jgi:hypothetical protein
MMDEPVDPLAQLRHHVRHQAATFEPGTSVDELIAHITIEHHRGSRAASAGAGAGAGGLLGRKRRRFSSTVVGITLFVGIAAGAVVTATVIDQKKVETPERGVVCHTSVDDVISASVVGATSDPIGACAALWNAGELPVIGEISPPSDPPLVACTGPRGVVDVFPTDDPELCTRLGMSVADLDAMVSDPRIELSERISDINLLCPSPADAAQQARELLDELGLDGWTVVPAEGEGCSALAISIEADLTIDVVMIPPPP